MKPLRPSGSGHVGVERRVVVELVLAQPVVQPVHVGPVEGAALTHKEREPCQEELPHAARRVDLVRKVAVDAAADADDEEQVVDREDAEQRRELGNPLPPPRGELPRREREADRRAEHHRDDDKLVVEEGGGEGVHGQPARLPPAAATARRDVGQLPLRQARVRDIVHA